MLWANATIWVLEDSFMEGRGIGLALMLAHLLQDFVMAGTDHPGL